MSLSVTPERSALPRTDLRAVLRNEASESLELSPTQWVPYKHVGDRWYAVHPFYLSGTTAGEVPPEGTVRETVAVDNTDLSAPAPLAGDRERDGPLRGLGAGAYALVVVGTPADGVGQPTTARPERRVAYVGRFVLTGERLTVEPSSRVRRTERDGDTLHVWAGPEGDRDTRVVVESTPEPGPGAARRHLLAEAVFRAEPLRNTLGAMDDLVQRVVLRTDARFPPFLSAPTLAYRGDHYRYEVSAPGRRDSTARPSSGPPPARPRR